MIEIKAINVPIYSGWIDEKKYLCNYYKKSY